jgi:hypothetical protein
VRALSCHYRAAEWGHEDIEPAAHELLQYLDDSRAARVRHAVVRDDAAPARAGP